MSARDFSFVVQVSESSTVGDMGAELAAQVAAHAGCDAEAATEVAAAVRRVLDERAASGMRDCRLVFRAASGEFEIVVSSSDGDEWRRVRRLPSAE